MRIEEHISCAISIRDNDLMNTNRQQVVLRVNAQMTFATADLFVPS